MTVIEMPITFSRRTSLPNVLATHDGQVGFGTRRPRLNRRTGGPVECVSRFGSQSAGIGERAGPRGTARHGGRPEHSLEQDRQIPRI